MGRNRRSRGADDDGFTLIELMVVVLIIAILIAIAVPTYLGARERAGERAAQTNVRSAFTAARVHYNTRLTYSDDPAVMTEVEPSLEWTDAALTSSAPARTVYVAVHDTPTAGQTVVVGGRTTSGTCFFIKDVMSGAAGTFYSSADVGTAACPTPDPATITAGTWSS